MKLFLLRGLLVVDAGVLFLLGALMVVQPTEVQRVFHFQELPPTVAYMVGMWGCVMGSLGFGYLVAATDPLRHRIWVQVGILRGGAEFFLGIYYLARSTVTFQQAGFGTLLAGLMALAYILLYPRLPGPTAPVTGTPATPPV